MSELPPIDDLRLPADALICYYLFANGQGIAKNIADATNRTREYTATRLRALESDHGLVEPVGPATGVVTLTPAGVTFADEIAADYILPDQREAIESVTRYTVSWD